MSTALANLDYDEVPNLLRLGNELVRSGMMPAHVRNPGAALACILTGRELGLGPMASIRGIHVVKGRVILSADTMLAVAIRRGIKHTWLSQSDTEARVRLVREGWDPHEHSFTIGEAKRADLAGGDNWRKYPAAMLRARCISAALRAYCPDIFSGVYEQGEAADIRGDQSVQVGRVQEVVVLGDTDTDTDVEAVDAEVVEEVPSAWRDRLRKLWHGRLGGLGYSKLDDDARHNVQEALFGARSLNDLDKAGTRRAGELLREWSDEELRGHVEDALHAAGGEE